MKNPLKIAGLCLGILFLIVLFAWYFFLYDVPFSAPFLKQVCKDTYLNLASIAKVQKKAGKVWKGSDGWLFYSKDISTLLLRWRFNANNVKLMCDLDNTLKVKGIQVVLVPVPDKVDIYPETCLPSDAPAVISGKRASFFSLFEKTGTSIIDLYPDFLKVKGAGLLYYKTDTHWNSAAKKIATERILGLLKPVNFERHLSGPARMIDTTITHSTDLLNNLLGDTTMTTSPMTCVVDSEGKPLAKIQSSEVIIIGDSFGRNDKLYGADLGSLLAYRLHTPVGEFCTSVVDGADFFRFVKRSLDKLSKPPKIVIIVFSSRKLLWKLKS